MKIAFLTFYISDFVIHIFVCINHCGCYTYHLVGVFFIKKIHDPTI